MREKKENEISHSGAVHPAVLQVSGDQTRRWSAAIWSVHPGVSALVREIHELIEGTLVAQLSLPPSHYEQGQQGFDSFDLVFYEVPGAELVDFLSAEGWQEQDVESLTTEELGRLSVFQNEARKVKVEIPEMPAALWRLPVSSESSELEKRVEAAARQMGKEVGDQVFGEQPGWFSRSFCEALGQRVQVQITPNSKGIAALEDIIVERTEGCIQVPNPAVFQALCDFVGVVLQAQGHVEVQWGTSPVDEATGLAPAPLMRMRHRGGVWKVLPVGRDIVRLWALPWGAPPEESRLLVGLVEEYTSEP